MTHQVAKPDVALTEDEYEAELSRVLDAMRRSTVEEGVRWSMATGLRSSSRR